MIYPDERGPALVRNGYTYWDTEDTPRDSASIRLDEQWDTEGLAVCDMCWDDFSEKQAERVTLIVEGQFIEATLCPKCSRIEAEKESKENE